MTAASSEAIVRLNSNVNIATNTSDTFQWFDYLKYGRRPGLRQVGAPVCRRIALENRIQSDDVTLADSRAQCRRERAGANGNLTMELERRRLPATIRLLSQSASLAGETKSSFERSVSGNTNRTWNTATAPDGNSRTEYIHIRSSCTPEHTRPLQ